MMRKWRSGAGLIFSLGLVVAMIGGSVLVASATPPGPDGHKVNICHAVPEPANQPTNHYNLLDVDIASSGYLQAGHNDHPKDIIPPYSYTPPTASAATFHFAGLNWAAGQAIWENDCKIPGAKDPTSVATQSSETGSDVDPGTSVTDLATVTNTNSGGPVPTGSVQFKISFNGGAATDVGSPKTLDGTGKATSDAISGATDTAYGEYCWQAFFTATGDFENSSETDKTNECFTVSGPYDPSTTTTTVVFNAATNAALVGNLPVNGSAYDTSTVTHLGGGTPTGTIAYTFYTNNTCSGDGTSAGSGLALGTKSSTKGPLAAGQYSFKAAFTSNTEDFNSSTSVCEPFTVSPAQLNPTPSPTGGVLAATGATPPTQDLAISLMALGLIAMMGGAFAWRRREA